MLTDILSGLNKSQLNAVSHKVSPVLVLAGPGTGKTRLLVARIAWLMEKEKIPAGKILALTFTNKAAGELKSRLSTVVGEAGISVQAGTFHAFALTILRKYHKQAQLDRFFTVCDQDYQTRLLRNLASPYLREDLDKKVKGIQLSISNHQIRSSSLSRMAQEIYGKYKAHLEKHNLIDFNQIMVKCHDLLQKNEDILAEYRFLFPAILVDEFQDTDAVQYELLKLLAWEHRNIFVVADDDQSIYSWRGANPENVKKFMEDFGIEQPVFLDINYRSGKTILAAANEIISKTNRIEPDKNLRKLEDHEDIFDLKFFDDEKSEVEFILKKIFDWTESGVAYSEMAVIYPYHIMGQQLESHLLQEKIPFQMASGKSILDHPVIRKVILHLRLIRDAEDPLALEELVSHELGQSLTEMVRQNSRQKSISFRKSLYDFYSDNTRRLSYDLKLKIQAFIHHLANIINLKDFYSFESLVEEIHGSVNYNQSSVFSGFNSMLSRVDKVADMLGFQTVSLTGRKIYVCHPDDRIAYLAAQLVREVLDTELITAAGQIDDETTVLALEPVSDAAWSTVEIFRLKDAQRQGALSCLFKFLQWYTTHNEQPFLQDYVVLDLETTGKDTTGCGIVEIAAVKVENGQKTAELQSLINPEMPISEGAQAVHNISDSDVKDAPVIAKLWPEFKSFIGDSVIIAHNGYQFDFPILDRYARLIDGQKLGNIRFDSLTMARKLYPNQANSIDALMERFGLTAGERHRALEDVVVLVDIFRNLQKKRLDDMKQTSLETVLDIVALGNAIENRTAASEDQIFFRCGGRKLISHFSKIPSLYADKFGPDQERLVTMIRDRLNQVQPQTQVYQTDEDQWLRIREMTRQFSKEPIDEAIAGFLAFISLNTAQDQLREVNAVSLLTYHAAKGLEFDKVILLGLENSNMPSFSAMREDADDGRPVSQKMEEQRRLLYVGLTRAKTELILTAVKNRGGWERESSVFLKDLKNLKIENTLER